MGWVLGLPWRMIRWFFVWRNLRRCLVAFACLITLIAAFYAEENWRGKHAWEKFKHEWEAKGEKFDMASVIPPPVPDDQNFAMTPFLAPLFDFDPALLKEGRHERRDTNAWKRTDVFATELFTADRYKTNGRRWPKEEKSDFDIWTLLLQTNLPASNAPFASHAEAAAALLKDLEKYRPVLDELQAASHRPYCRFNLYYSEADPAAILLPHLALVRRLALMFELRAAAELAIGSNNEALADTRMVIYMAGTVKNEPILISGLVRIAILRIACQGIENGLIAHQWTDSNLAELESELGKIDLLADYVIYMRGERAFGNGIMDYLREKPSRAVELGVESDNGENNNSSTRFSMVRIMPSGWYYANELLMNRIHLEYLTPLVDPVNRHVYAAKTTQVDSKLQQLVRHGFPPKHTIAMLLLPALTRVPEKFARGQVYTDEDLVACALERYRLANGKFPETLAALEPQFLKAIPRDVFSGEPLKYRPTDDGQFVLYSIGWNEKDDGGIVVTNATGKSPDISKGDWVWLHYPSP